MGWTKKKNIRRCELIDKKIDFELTPEEESELEILQQEMFDWKRKKFPNRTEEAKSSIRKMMAPPTFKGPFITFSKSGSVVTIQCENGDDADEVLAFLEDCVTEIIGDP